MRKPHHATYFSLWSTAAASRSLSRGQGSSQITTSDSVQLGSPESLRRNMALEWRATVSVGHVRKTILRSTSYFEVRSTSKYAFNAVWPTLHAHHFSFAVGCLLAAWRPRSGWSHGRAVPVRACCCWWRRYCVRPASPQRLHCASRHEPSPSQRQRRCSRYAQRWPRCTAVLKGSRACYSPGYLQCSRF